MSSHYDLFQLNYNKENEIEEMLRNNNNNKRLNYMRYTYFYKV